MTAIKLRKRAANIAKMWPVLLACCLLLVVSIVPAWGWIGRAEGKEHNSTTDGRRGFLAQYLWENDAFWQQLLRISLPKSLLGSESVSPIAAWGNSFLQWVDHLSVPRTFLAMGVPCLRWVPGYEHASEAEMLPANEPEVPPLVPMLPTGSTDVMAMGWKYTPKALIYHTHNVESYKPTAGKAHVYDDPEQTVVRVGAKLADELRAQGIDVVHSRADNVKNAYSAAYVQSLKTVTEVLQQDASIEYVFDIHRDAVPRSATTAVVAGQSVARIYIVVGTNEALGHKRWRQNLAFAQQLHQQMEKMYPGLSRGILQREKMRYNQHVRDNALLIEIGGDANTMDEALRAASFLADALTATMKMQQGQLP